MSNQPVKKEINFWNNDPILLQSFKNSPEEAVTFYSSQIEKLFLANFLLDAQLKKSIEEKQQLAQRIIEMEKNQKNSQQEQKKKRHRRCASEIKRQFICKMAKCGKSYGSEGSLSQHMKLKHPEVQQQQLKIQQQLEKKL